MQESTSQTETLQVLQQRQQQQQQRDLICSNKISMSQAQE
jgi:hypothetical protein